MSRRAMGIASSAVLSLALLAACGDGEATFNRGPKATGTTEPHWVILCSAPDRPATVMPDVVGKDLRSAAKLVCDLGIRLGDIHGLPDATVYAQHPVAGDPVDAGTRADLKAR